MTVVLVVVGVMVAGLALRDVLHEILHPSGSGSISQRIMRAGWALFRWIGGRWPGALPLAGPVIFVTVLVVWALMLAIGWALVYWPFLPESFRFASPLAPAAQDGFDDALYLSLTALATLGFGDITATTPWLRVLSTIQGLVGFALLTAGMSWILSLYPVLTRRRAFASRVIMLDDASRRTGIDVAGRDAGDATRVLDELAAQLCVLRADLMLSPLSYYFHDNEPGVALPLALPMLLCTADLARDSDSPSVRHAAASLAGTIDAFAELVGSAHLDMRRAGTVAVLSAYAQHHPYRPPPSS